VRCDETGHGSVGAHEFGQRVGKVQHAALRFAERKGDEGCNDEKEKARLDDNGSLDNELLDLAQNGIVGEQQVAAVAVPIGVVVGVGVATTR